MTLPGRLLLAIGLCGFAAGPASAADSVVDGPPVGIRQGRAYYHYTQFLSDLYLVDGLR